MRAPDLTIALRNLIRRPAFAITAILLLALGAGANAAVFSVVRGILLRPLAFPQAERLVAIWPDGYFSNEEIDWLRTRAQSFDAISGLSPGWMMSLVIPGQQPVKVTAGRTLDNFFTTLGVDAALGRTIVPGEALRGRNGVVVLSASLFEQQFGGDPSAIGRRVLIDGLDHEVIGVMPRGFEFMRPGTDVWVPWPYDPSSAQQQRSTSLAAFGRLVPGLTVMHASSALQALAPIARGELDKVEDWARDIRAISLHEAVTGDVRSTLLILLAAVGLIFLLAAVNLGTLVLGRSMQRTREIAVRTALGASRARLIRQLVVEQAVIASAGAITGLGLAYAALPILVRGIPAEMPRQHDIVLDVVVFATVFSATILIAITMALVPVAIGARPELQPLLRQTHSTEPPARRRALGALVAAQIALAVILGIGAGLMLRTLWNLQQVDPGFQASNVLTFRLQTTSRRLNLPRGLVYFDRVVERVRALPGVVTVGAIQHLPMSGYNWTAYVWRPDDPPAPGSERPTAIWRFTGWDYFSAMGIRLRAGRAFTPQDQTDAPAVAIINEALAQREFGSAEAAVGRRLVSVSAGGEQVIEVVGVIRDVRYASLDIPARPELYRPLAQTFMFPMAFVVRTTGEPSSIAAAVRQAAFEVDPMIPVAELQPLTSLLAGSLGRPRLLAFLLSIFAAAGLALGLIGVYGVVSYRVRQQERELGIRLALGAGPQRIAQRVLSQGLAYAVAGLVIGVPIAFALARFLDSAVYGVTPHDPLTFTVLPVAVMLTAVVACAIPARRAARVDPATTIRAE